MSEFKFKQGEWVVFDGYSTTFNDVYEVVMCRLGLESPSLTGDPQTVIPDELVMIKIIGTVRTTLGINAWWVFASDFKLYNGTVPSVETDYKAMQTLIDEIYPKEELSSADDGVEYMYPCKHDIEETEEQPDYSHQKVKLEDFKVYTECVKNLFSCSAIKYSDEFDQYLSDMLRQKTIIFE